MSIKDRAVAGLKLVAFASSLAQFLSWVITVLVIRLLEPNDYALMNMALMFVGLVMLVNELGAIPAYIQHTKPSPHLTRQVQSIVLLSSALIYIGIFLGAPAIAVFFDQPELTAIVRVIGIKVVVGAIGALPIATLQRDLDFKRISIVQVISVASGSLVTLLLAYLGRGVWALVYGNLVIVCLNSALMLTQAGLRVMPTLDLSGTGSLMRFGLQVTLNRFIYYGRTQVDHLFVAKMLSANQLGIYAVAFHLATTIMSKMMGFVNQVAFPAYSRLQSDRSAVSRYVLRSNQVCAFLLFPTFWGLSAVADMFVDLLLGQKWAAAATVLQIICLSVPFQAMGFLLGPVLNGLGRPDLLIRNGITYLVLLIGASWLLIDYGINGVAFAVLFSSLLGLALNFRRSSAELGVGGFKYLATFWPPLAISAAMFAAVTAMSAATVELMPLSIRLIVCVVTGAAVYSVGILLFARETATLALSLVRR